MNRRIYTNNRFTFLFSTRFTLREAGVPSIHVFHLPALPVIKIYPLPPPPATSISKSLPSTTTSSPTSRGCPWSIKYLNSTSLLFTKDGLVLSWKRHQAWVQQDVEEQYEEHHTAKDQDRRLVVYILVGSQQCFGTSSRSNTRRSLRISRIARRHRHSLYGVTRLLKIPLDF